MRKCWTHNSRVDQAVVPVGGGRARPGLETRRIVLSTTRPTGVEGAGGTGGPGQASRRGLAAVPVGGGGAWPGFETTRRAKLAARTARGRAAAHGHTKQPGPRMRKPRPADAGRGFRYPVGYEV